MQAAVYREMAIVQQDHWWFAARRKIIAALIECLSLPRQARVLEIGCGPGGNLAMLARFGELQAMEYNANARLLAEGLGICKVHVGGLPGPVPFEDASFDLICLLDVLEHIEDDTAALTRIARLLKPDGQLLITVPAYAWLWSEHDVTHHHYRRYTAPMLQKRAKAAGLTPSRLGYFNTLLFPLIGGIRLTRKLLGMGSSSDAAQPGPLTNKLLGTLFGLESHAIPRMLFPFGTSVMAVLSRQP